MITTISNSNVLIKPSKELIKHIKSLDDCEDLPPSFISLRLRKTQQHTSSQNEYCSLITDADREFIETLKLSPAVLEPRESCEVERKSVLLNTNDLLWLLNKLRKNEEKVYLHELLSGSEVILPCNEEIPRNEELDKRCQLLKRQQENQAYKAMTRDVDSVRKHLPEDTISYQIKQLNRQLIAVAQFVISVIAGFMFGFQGVELIVGTLDFGFRLLLGVICSLTIALAELYFLAKRLNEDLQFKNFQEEKKVHAKMD